MFPYWWCKLRHSGMDAPTLRAYSALRIRRALAAVLESDGRMARRELAAHAREIGNAVVELGYFDKGRAIRYLGGRDLFFSICEARGLLSHDENALPPNRILDFFRAADALGNLADALLEVPGTRERVPMAEKYLMDDSNPVIEFDPKSLAGLPWRPGSPDCVALCYAVMIKDVEWGGDDPVERFVDYSSRGDLAISVSGEDLPLFPHKRIGAIRKMIISGDEGHRDECARFMGMRNGAGNGLAEMRGLVRRNGWMPLVAELSGWLDANKGRFRMLRREFVDSWIESCGEFLPMERDRVVSGIFGEPRFKSRPTIFRQGGM